MEHNTNKIIFSPEFLEEGDALGSMISGSRLIFGGHNSQELHKFIELLKDSSSWKLNTEILFMSSKDPHGYKKTLSSPYTGVKGWIDSRLPLIRMMEAEYLKFPVPKSLNYFWSFGGIAMFCLIGLILSGIFLGMHYKPSAAEAFNSVER